MLLFLQGNIIFDIIVLNLIPVKFEMQIGGMLSGYCLQNNEVMQ